VAASTDEGFRGTPACCNKFLVAWHHEHFPIKHCKLSLQLVESLDLTARDIGGRGGCPRESLGCAADSCETFRNIFLKASIHEGLDETQWAGVLGHFHRILNNGERWGPWRLHLWLENPLPL
jgi:hypothetical protein